MLRELEMVCSSSERQLPTKTIPRKPVVVIEDEEQLPRVKSDQRPLGQIYRRYLEDSFEPMKDKHIHEAIAKNKPC